MTLGVGLALSLAAATLAGWLTARRTHAAQARVFQLEQEKAELTVHAEGLRDERDRLREEIRAVRLEIEGLEGSLREREQVTETRGFVERDGT